MKKIITIILAFAMAAGLLAVNAGAIGMSGFKDVSDDDYFCEPVSWAVEQKITTGVTATAFAPDDTCTRAQILTFLWRAVGKPAVLIRNPFSDVTPDQYYYEAALWAYENQMVVGTTFSGNTPCTRAAVVTYQWQLAGCPTGFTHTFTDVADSADYSQAVAWAVSEKITTGTTAATFSPDDTCTRGQIVTFLWRDLAEKKLYEEQTYSSSWTCTFQCGDQFLSYAERTLVLSDTAATWRVVPAKDGSVYVYAGDTELLLDIDNAWISAGTTVKIWEMTGYTAQIWDIATNKNGSISFLSSDDARLCLGFDGNSAKLEKRKEGEWSQEFKVVCTAVDEKSWCEFVSDDGVITLQLDEEVFEVISQERLQQWANDLSTAYDSFYELTGFKPYENVILQGFDVQEYYAFVRNNDNTIYYDKDCLYTDLAKMAVRENDWNFGALHEMGHMFDFYMPWNFEAECLTDLKIPYVLEMNNAVAVPSEFPASASFVGADIINAYEQLGDDFSSSYDIYGLAHRFMEIKNNIGWEPFKQTFRSMQADSDNTDYLSNTQRLHEFISLLEKFSGRDIRGYFSNAEWKCIVVYIDG